ncbi:MAG: 2-methylcitrate dehydratase [Burkholderiales bacterium RIFCSPLOWO2_12_FULL_64_99]|nr:MAG: 2-methylcitrate dehydratase [Burkholderiales bacterium RIFCSPHIGHO2_12_FULL_63_20]OGB61978.1 MAG: 2-methylcitrate dehydratase [Burkholderiales bacterium RIFCSPLOWO2_12_FULL_64_99]
MSNPSATLAAFTAQLRFDDLPETVVRKIEDLLVDWFGSAVAGHGSRPVGTITQFAQMMGPATGPAEVITTRASTSPYLAAMANAAASHVAEQDDVHNGSVFHPATVVFPAAVAMAQALGASGRDLLTACVAGYEVGIRIGEFLGRSHYRVFHTTGTVGTLAAAAAVGHLLKLDAKAMQHALGSAGTQSAGLWEFLRTAADSKQLHTAHAAAAGLMSAALAQQGFTGAAEILEGPQGMGVGMSTDADPARLTDGLDKVMTGGPVTRWATVETSFKYHASCRHTHPAADALLAVMQAHGLGHHDLAQVTTRVHQGAIDVLGPVVKPVTVHQSKFSMGTVLALVAQYGHAGLVEFEHHFQDEVTQALRDRVTMVLDEEVDSAYPRRWIGKVTVTTQDGRVFEGRVDEPKGDPGNTLSREELTAKALRLSAFSQGATAAEMASAIDRLWQIASWPTVGRLLPERTA